MDKFKELKKELLQDKERTIKNDNFYIENGYCENWSDENKKQSDEGLRRYGTYRRWAQYQNGEIKRAQAVELAIKRNQKKLEKQFNQKLEKLQAVENAPKCNYITINVDWIKNPTWGMNPRVEIFTDCNNEILCGSASGCGYDKESSAIAQALNKSKGVLKILYELKEKALRKDKNINKRASACTGIDNREAIGYGAGNAFLSFFFAIHTTPCNFSDNLHLGSS